MYYKRENEEYINNNQRRSNTQHLCLSCEQRPDSGCYPEDENMHINAFNHRCCCQTHFNVAGNFNARRYEVITVKKALMLVKLIPQGQFIKQPLEFFRSRSNPKWCTGFLCLEKWKYKVSSCFIV